MLSAVAEVLEAHGLQLRAVSERDPKIWATLLVALGQVVDAVPAEYGGRAGDHPEQPPAESDDKELDQATELPDDLHDGNSDGFWIDSGSGPGYPPDPEPEADR
jgi:hypothetical protein